MAAEASEAADEAPRPFITLKPHCSGNKAVAIPTLVHQVGCGLAVDGAVADIGILGAARLFLEEFQ